MAKVDIINLNGEKVKDIKLNDAIYNIESNEVVVKKALDLQLASLRQGTHKTTTSAGVSGGGRKPYKQRGSGNARQGSTRAPHYRHGGVAFGVTPRDYTFKMNKKERVLALRSVLSMKAKENNIKVIDSLTVESLKTKDLKNMLSNLGLNGKTLFITSNDAENLYLASRNLNNVGVLLTSELNVYDMLHADTIVLDEEAVKQIEEVLK